VAWGSAVRSHIPKYHMFCRYAVEQNNVGLKSISIISNMVASLVTCSSEWLGVKADRPRSMIHSSTPLA
jgi:hypothetical protein